MGSGGKASKAITQYNATSQIRFRSERKELVDTQSGEIIQVDQIYKKAYGAKQFWKMYLMDFLIVLGVIDSKQLDVFIYIVEHTSPVNNLFMGTYKEIARNVDVSEGTIAKIMRKLQEKRFIKMKYRGVWFVNPDVLMKGSERKRQILLTYDEVGSPEEEEIIISRGNRTRIEEKPTTKPELEGQLNMGDLPVWDDEEVKALEERTNP